MLYHFLLELLIGQPQGGIEIELFEVEREIVSLQYLLGILVFFNCPFC